jgi:hypothetical protein
MRKMNKFDLSEFALAYGEELEPTSFPRLDNISAAFLYKFIPRPQKLSPPEFVYVPLFPEEKLGDNYYTKAFLTITQWDALWEAGQLRPEFFSQVFQRDFPKKLNWLKKYRRTNLYLIPDGRKVKYDAYVPLYHLLPHRTLIKHNLPSFRRGFWPPWAAPNHALDQFIDPDFGNHLSRAFAWHIWPLLDSGSRINAFSKDYPLTLLAHNLDFWLPYSVLAIEKRLKRFSFVPFENDAQHDELEILKRKMPSNIRAGRPRRGGAIWIGEEEAWEVTKEVVEMADRQGKLRAIIDAIRSNQIEDDFSGIWSYAKEDFERKLYQKRSKIKVTFVELKETIPVHGSTSEVHENLLWEDFLALLNVKERHIAICLRNGVSKIGDIAKSLGYANHSPVSKALSRIRIKAKTYLDC